VLEINLGKQLNAQAISNPGAIRKIRILALLRQRGPMSRAELSRATGISKSSISLIVDQLILQGSVQQLQATPANRNKTVRGRPGELIEIDPSSGAAIGIEISYNKIVGIIGDVSHQILATRIVEVEPKSQGGKLNKIIQELVSDLMSAARITPSRILGIGIGKLELEKDHDLNLQSNIRLSTGFSCRIEKSSNLSAFSEMLWGSGRSYENVIYLKIEEFIGGALVVNNQVIRGTYGEMGDFGHLTVDFNGQVCRCGHRGCLDTYSGLQAILNSSILALGYEISLENFEKMISKEDVICNRILRDSAIRVGQAASMLTRVLRPDAVIIGSTILNIQGSYFKWLNSAFREDLAGALPTTELLLGSLGLDSSAMGAVAMVLNQPEIAPSPKWN
jgi:predicted NBD/HSP70 family sugar kinase